MANVVSIKDYRIAGELISLDDGTFTATIGDKDSPASSANFPDKPSAISWMQTAFAGVFNFEVTTATLPI